MEQSKRLLSNPPLRPPNNISILIHHPSTMQMVSFRMCDWRAGLCHPSHLAVSPRCHSAHPRCHSIHPRLLTDHEPNAVTWNTPCLKCVNACKCARNPTILQGRRRRARSDASQVNRETGSMQQPGSKPLAACSNQTLQSWRNSRGGMATPLVRGRGRGRPIWETSRARVRVWTFVMLEALLGLLLWSSKRIFLFLARFAVCLVGHLGRRQRLEIVLQVIALRYKI